MFSARFWSADYNDGINTLLAKLGQGIVENNELLALARARADAEESHGLKLAQLAEQLAPRKEGFARDDGATMRRAYEGLLQQMGDEGRQHTHIADSIQKMVVAPFQKWADGHALRVDKSRSELKRFTKAYERELSAVHKSQQRYFNRCRLEEDGEDQAAGDESETQPSSIASDSRSVSGSSTVLRKSSGGNLPTTDEKSSEELVLGGEHYSADESQDLIKRMLTEIPQVDTKVPVLGVYDHTVTGAQIVEWLQANTAIKTLGDAEDAGQNLLNDGFMRLIGQFGSRFVNSSVFVYQWRPHAYEFGGLSIAIETGSSTAGGIYADLASKWRAAEGNTGQSVRELDQKYRKTVVILDKARLDLELVMFEHFGYLERCERERLAAFKAVILDFAAAISNVVPAMSASVDKMLLFHEISDVDRDLRFLVENYQTGRYDPKVVVYDNYYSSVDGAPVFGLDLDLRSRADKKRVPLFVSCTLSVLDSLYPSMENDSERLAAWQLPLSQNMRIVQTTRQQLNAPNLTVPQIREFLSKLPAAAIAQTLKLYFLELPNSVVGGQLYDLLRGVYSKFGGDAEEKKSARIQSLQNTLAQLTLSHIAVLDALTAHIARLVTIAKASRQDIEIIAQQWGSALCRPKVSSPLSLDDTFPTQILLDLLDHRDRVFGELKRHAAAVLTPQDSFSSSTSARFRSLSQRTASTQHSEPRTRDITPSDSRQTSHTVNGEDSSVVSKAMDKLAMSDTDAFADAEEQIKE